MEGFDGVGRWLLLLMRQRVELCALEVEEQLVLAAGTLAALLAIAVLAMLGLAALAAAVVAYWWETARMTALLGVAAVFIGTALAVGVRLVRAMNRRPLFLSATLDELRRDAELLQVLRTR